MEEWPRDVIGTKKPGGGGCQVNPLLSHGRLLSTEERLFNPATPNAFPPSRREEDTHLPVCLPQTLSAKALSKFSRRPRGDGCERPISGARTLRFGDSLSLAVGRPRGQNGAWEPARRTSERVVCTAAPASHARCRILSRKQGTPGARLLPPRLRRAKAPAQTPGGMTLGARGQLRGENFWRWRLRRGRAHTGERVPGSPSADLSQHPVPAMSRRPHSPAGQTSPPPRETPLRRDPEISLQTVPTSSGFFRVAAARLPWKPRPWRRPGCWAAASPSMRSAPAPESRLSPPGH